MENGILEGNEIIAIFMGEKVLPIKDNDLFPVIEGEFGLRQTKYHTSWDWLMPVCKKLDRLVEDGIIDYSMVYEAHCDNLDDAVTRSYDISEVFPVVVQFIHFYNTQSK